jgi:hypothetical protein
MNSLDIQRLVDGELSVAERALLLKRIDLTPQNWRTVALAMLEEQVFCDEILQANASQNVVSTSTIITPIASGAKNKDSLLDALRGSGRNGLLLSATFAASLLIIVGVAVVPFRRSGSQKEFNSTTEAANHASLPAMVSGDGWGHPVGELTLTSDDLSIENKDTPSAVERGASANDLNKRIPVYEVRAEQAKQWIEDEARRVASLREQLRQHGYELDSKPNRIEKTLPDGRALIVPVNQWNVRPIGQ